MGATQSIERPFVLETSTQGSLKGIEQTHSKTGKAVCTRYTRIPYAQPPVGDRRWRRPQPLPEDFSFDAPNGEPGDYTEFGNLSPQPIYGYGDAMLENKNAAKEAPKNYSEDCLYLNIWVPAGAAPRKGWPVQFYIHGGWLQVGDAAQTANHDPFDLLEDYPRIIVAPTYRLNLFGFLASSELAEESGGNAGNWGFWDQRLALEWTYSNIDLFGGNPNNISAGGLSAGSYSTVFQLHYDTYRTDLAERIIKRVFLYSNSVGIQPKPTKSVEIQAQFEELLTSFGIPKSLPSAEKLSMLRGISSEKLIEQIKSLKHHTFRSTTDDEFVSSKFLASIHDGSFTDQLRKHDVSLMIGEVADEALLYRYINPATSLDSMISGLNNYYPSTVTTALLKLYDLPSSSAPPSAWTNVSANIIADCQVHAMVRGFTSTLLNPKPGNQPLPLSQVFRYRISWRAKGLDAWLSPAVGVCHAADIPIWWHSGRRAGFSAEDIAKCKVFLAPFEQFLAGEKVEWGTETPSQIRQFSKDGVVRVVEDEGWERGLKVWDAMWKAQSSQ